MREHQRGGREKERERERGPKPPQGSARKRSPRHAKEGGTAASTRVRAGQRIAGCDRGSRGTRSAPKGREREKRRLIGSAEMRRGDMKRLSVEIGGEKKRAGEQTAERLAFMCTKRERARAANAAEHR